MEENKKYKEIHTEIDEFLVTSNGQTFRGTMLDNLYGYGTREAKRYRWQILQRKVTTGELENKGPDKYRQPIEEFEEIDVMSADINKKFDILWPMDLGKYLKVYSQSVIVLAGAPGAGKTAILHNIALRNMNHPAGVVMFSNDMTDVEIKERWVNSGLVLPPKPFPIFEVYSSFGDAIKAKKTQNSINFIDYLDLNSDIYKIGDEIEGIYRSLDEGVAFVGIQKKYGQDLGMGGVFGLKRAKIYLSLDVLKENGKLINSLKIIKTRGRIKPDINPVQMEFKYNLIGGIKLRQREIC